MQTKCRRLDIVTVKGSEVPISIYTYDCLQDQVFCSKPITAETLAASKRFEKTLKTVNPEEGQKKKIGPSGVSYQAIVPLDIDDSQTALVIDDAQGFVQQGEVQEKVEVEKHHEAHVHGTPTDSHSHSHAILPRFEIVDGPLGVFLTNANDTQDVIERDDDMLSLRAHITPEFLDIFKEGVNTYLAGDWPLARGQLEKASALMKELVRKTIVVLILMFLNLLVIIFLFSLAYSLCRPLAATVTVHV